MPLPLVPDANSISVIESLRNSFNWYGQEQEGKRKEKKRKYIFCSGVIIELVHNIDNSAVYYLLRDWGKVIPASYWQCLLSLIYRLVTKLYHLNSCSFLGKDTIKQNFRFLGFWKLSFYEPTKTISKALKAENKNWKLKTENENSFLPELPNELYRFEKREEQSA